ncbi:sensor histidine kinase [Saccharibacillus sp. O23]|uniref:sensor histidine kinase n=1 Tax=Saccharibacillus sp. O23 TaxID=2009338 RepID=UPI00211ACF26|nr:sensor histidine kinase [Saccharibacillus sp. O23]
MRKIILGYILFIFIPVIGFGYFYYAQTSKNLIDQFVSSRQKVLEQAYANLRTDFARIQSVHRMLQYNPYLVDYLDGAYDYEGDSVYSFIRYIQPIYTQSYFADPAIESLSVYKMKPDVFTITDYFTDISALDPALLARVESLKPGKGIWLRRSAESQWPELNYYQYLYNGQFTERIGLLEMRTNQDLFERFYEAAGIEGKWRATLLSEQGEPWNGEARTADLDDAMRQRLANGELFFVERNTIVNQVELDELGVRLVVTGQVDQVFHSVKKRETVLVGAIVALLIGLSALYYGLASTITKRILALAGHMRAQSDDNLKQYAIETGTPQARDEIGFLTVTYNAMIQRMDELINNVHKAELRNKEAAYKVLQAQIKPHFLYNTLETIRMLAESNNDREVADISYWFGKLMRYSLSSEDDQTVLAQEIETVVFYLNIHKMRLQDRLIYEIDVRVDAKKVFCPRFILQPLIENSIVHGATTLKPVHIRLQAAEEDGEIAIRITDSGVGIPAEKLAGLQKRLRDPSGVARESGTGEGNVGLVNVSERVKSFFGDGSRLLLDSREGEGTQVTLRIAKGEDEPT